jgi:Protein of unknown function (DUF2975)
VSRLDAWLRRCHAAATFIFIAALCLAGALVVIAFIPGSPVTQALPADALSGFDHVGGVTSGAVVQASGWVPFKVLDPSLTDRLLFMLTQVPGLLLIAEVARRMAKLLRGARDSDPFTLDNVRALATLGKLTAFVGVGTWVVSQIAQGVLSARMLSSAPTYQPHHAPLGWLAVGLIFAAFSLILDRGVAMRAELDTVI